MTYPKKKFCSYSVKRKTRGKYCSSHFVFKLLLSSDDLEDDPRGGVWTLFGNWSFKKQPPFPFHLPFSHYHSCLERLKFQSLERRSKRRKLLSGRVRSPVTANVSSIRGWERRGKEDKQTLSEERKSTHTMGNGVGREIHQRQLKQQLTH